MGNLEHIQEGNNEDPHATPNGKKSQKQFLVFAGIGVLILIIAFTVLFKAHDRALRIDVNTVNLKLTTLEMSVSRLEGELKELRQFVSKLEASGRPPTPTSDELSRRIDRLEKTIAADAQRPETSTPVPEKTTIQTKTGYHEVRRGETLFRISQNYGLSLEQLCGLNQMTPQTPIHPGQKLLVAPEKSKNY